jgi:hypothetical protein
MKRDCLSLIICLAVPVLLAGPAISAEITEIGPSARPIAMGRAYSAARNTADSMLYNPAGLAGIDSFQFSSMYSNLSIDFTYTSLAAAVPVRYGTLGFAVLNQHSGALYRTVLDADGRVSMDGYSPFFFTNQVYLASFSGDLDNRLSAGGRVKIYEKEAGSVPWGYGTGTAFDVGMLYRLSKDTDAGIYLENILSSGISWPTGTREPLPQRTKAGVMHRPGNGWTIALDAVAERGRPLLLKAGGEWRAHELISLRAGLEQADTGSERYLNYSLGAGSNFDSFQINYAYTADAALKENSSHFVSISLSAPPLPADAQEAEQPAYEEKTETSSEKLEAPKPPQILPRKEGPGVKDLTQQVLKEKELVVRARIHELDSLIRAARAVNDTSREEDFQREKRRVLDEWKETKSSLANPLESEIRRTD